MVPSNYLLYSKAACQEWLRGIAEIDWRIAATHMVPNQSPIKQSQPGAVYNTFSMRTYIALTNDAGGSKNMRNASGWNTNESDRPATCRVNEPSLLPANRFMRLRWCARYPTDPPANRPILIAAPFEAQPNDPTINRSITYQNVCIWPKPHELMAKCAVFGCMLLISPHTTNGNQPDTTGNGDGLVGEAEGNGRRCANTQCRWRNQSTSTHASNVNASKPIKEISILVVTIWNNCESKARQQW